jgi:DNA-directed RNA polymerase subunit RPC12/RpoP
MQLNLSAIILLASAAIVVSGIVISMLLRVKRKCPECGSKELVETNRETHGTRMIETVGSGTGAGGNLRLQLDFEVTYRCKKCGEIFKRKFSETQ